MERRSVEPFRDERREKRRGMKEEMKEIGRKE